MLVRLDQQWHLESNLGNNPLRTVFTVWSIRKKLLPNTRTLNRVVWVHEEQTQRELLAAFVTTRSYRVFNYLIFTLYFCNLGISNFPQSSFIHTIRVMSNFPSYPHQQLIQWPLMVLCSYQSLVLFFSHFSIQPYIGTCIYQYISKILMHIDNKILKMRTRTVYYPSRKATTTLTCNTKGLELHFSMKKIALMVTFVCSFSANLGHKLHPFSAWPARSS